MTQMRAGCSGIDANLHVEVAGSEAPPAVAAHVEGRTRLPGASRTVLAIVFHARGGAGDKALNTEYAEGLRLVVHRLTLLRVTLLDVVVDSRTAQTLPWSDRRCFQSVPCQLVAGGADATRKAIMLGAAKAGRAKGATGSGNATKRLRLYVALPDGQDMTAAQLEAKLAEGDL